MVPNLIAGALKGVFLGFVLLQVSRGCARCGAIPEQNITPARRIVGFIEIGLSLLIAGIAIRNRQALAALAALPCLAVGLIILFGEPVRRA